MSAVTWTGRKVVNRPFWSTAFFGLGMKRIRPPTLGRLGSEPRSSPLIVVKWM
jgi:hypothetical protein